MARILKLINRYLEKSIPEYLIEIEKHSTEFIINKETLINLIAGSINEYHAKSILFVCLAISEDKRLDAYFKDTPKYGIELINKRLSEGLGVYHIHLTEGYVLIWYLTWSSSGQIIKFRYVRHPAANDNYQTILNEIYEDEFGYNLSIASYFSDTKYLLNENILYFSDFIRL